MTVPTPFQAEEHIAEMIDKGYSLQKKQLGRPVGHAGLGRKIFIILGIIAAIAAAAAAIYFIVFH